MLHTTLVDANDLIIWADRLNARSQLPRLVRRLIQATTPSLEHIGFPADEDIQSAGWDGIVKTSVGNDKVPAGVSAWEMGVNKDPKGKADEDYSKRTNNPLGTNISQCTFVFVTPRRWPGKEQWLQDRNAAGKWKEVRAYDANDVITWLEQAPTVHIWLSMLSGRLPDGAISLDAFWEDWTNATKPPIHPNLVLGSLIKEAEQIARWLSSDP
jgi:hypothetical protein